MNTVYRICKETERRRCFEIDETTDLYQLGTESYIVGQRVGSRIQLRSKAANDLSSALDHI